MTKITRKARMLLILTGDIGATGQRDYASVSGGICGPDRDPVLGSRVKWTQGEVALNPGNFKKSDVILGVKGGVRGVDGLM